MAITAVQLISLSSEFTGTGDSGDAITIATNSIAGAKLQNNTVTFSKMQQVTTARLLGRATAGAGSIEEIQLGTNLSFSGTTLNATGGSGGSSETTLTAAGTSMVITYQGSSAPTLGTSAAGVYTLTEPAGTRVLGFDWTGDNGDVDGSGDITLNIVSTDGATRAFTCQILNNGNDEIADLPTLGVIVSQDRTTTPGTNISIFTTMGGFGAPGFTVLARFR